MLRIFLYSAIIIGCFANFARNGWGMELRGYAELILGITFIVEIYASLLKKNSTLSKGNRILANFERFFVFAFLTGGFFRAMHWPGSGFIYVIAASFIALLAIIRLFTLFYKNRLKFSQTIAMIFFMLSIAALSAGVLFKTMHWPFGSIMITIGCLAFILTLILGLLIKISDTEKTNLLQYSRKNYRVSHFIFFFFGIWSIYIVLAQNQLAPRFYTSENPYVYEKLLEEGNRDEAEMIHENYSLLIEEIEKKEAEQSTNQ